MFLECRIKTVFKQQYLCLLKTIQCYRMNNPLYAKNISTVRKKKDFVNCNDKYILLPDVAFIFLLLDLDYFESEFAIFVCGQVISYIILGSLFLLLNSVVQNFNYKTTKYNKTNQTKSNQIIITVTTTTKTQTNLPRPSNGITEHNLKTLWRCYLLYQGKG